MSRSNIFLTLQLLANGLNSCLVIPRLDILPSFPKYTNCNSANHNVSVGYMFQISTDIYEFTLMRQIDFELVLYMQLVI